jgi:phenylacetate-CoA ligase
LYADRGLTPSSVRTLADIAKFPTVSKQQIRADRQSFLASNAKEFTPLAGNTSGTTGSPFQFFSDRKTESIEWAFFWRHKSWAGARLFQPTISLGGRVIVPMSQQKPPFWRYNWAEGTMWLSTFHMSPENLDLYIERIRSSKLQFLRGYPSNLFIVARHMKQRDVRIPLKAVFSGSEPLFDYVRELVEDRFVCKVFDWYGVSERVVSSGQCEHHDGYHVHMENCLVEILNGETPVAGQELGEIVATCLSNQAMPLIRYRTGDLSSWRDQPCACGRGLRMLNQVQTKWEHVVTTADGRFISPSNLTHPFKPIRGITKSQIVQEAPDHVVIRVVATNEFTDSDRDLLLRGIQERLGARTRIDVRRVEDIPKDPSGKYRWVVSKVPFSFNQQRDSSPVGIPGG